MRGNARFLKRAMTASAKGKARAEFLKNLTTYSRTEQTNWMAVNRCRRPKRTW